MTTGKEPTIPSSQKTSTDLPLESHIDSRSLISREPSRKKQINELSRKGVRKVLAYSSNAHGDVNSYLIYDYKKRQRIWGYWNHKTNQYDEEKI